MKVDIQKLQEFKGQIKELNLAASKTENAITEAQRGAGVTIVREYYEYLKASGEPYGDAALQVVTDTGMFGKVANIHLRTQAVFDGKAKEYLPELQDRVMISLAFQDIEARIAHNGELDYESISKYHKQVFKALGLTEYAWGGFGVEELLGPGKWMMLHNTDEQGFREAITHLSKQFGTTSDYSMDRMVSALKHSLSCWTTVEKDYSPLIRESSIDAAAERYDVDVSRVVLYEDDTAESDVPWPASQVYKILPASEILPEHGSTKMLGVHDEESTPDKLDDHSEPGENGAGDEEGVEDGDKKEALSASSGTLGANVTINSLIRDLYNPAQLKQYQEASMVEAVQGLEEAEEFVPGIREASVESMRQTGEFLSQMMNLSMSRSGVAAQQSGVQNSFPGQSYQDQEWLSSLVSDTDRQMNDLLQNGGLEDVMSTLMGNFGSNS